MKIARITNDKKVLLADEIIEYPSELNGGRNYFIDKLMLDVTNYEKIGSYHYYTIENLSPNKTYTFSVKENFANEITIPTTGNRALRINNDKTNSIGVNIIDVRAAFGVRTYKGQINSNEDGKLFIVNYRPELLPEIYRMVKLEKGNTDTEWTPAPEDLGLTYDNYINYFTTGFRSNGDLLVGEIIEMDVKVQSKNLVRNGNYEYGEIEPWILYNGAQLSWDEEVGAYLFQGRADRNDLAYQELTLEPHTVYTLSLMGQRQYGFTHIRILRSLESGDYIADIALTGSSLSHTSTTFLTEGQTQYYISFTSTAVNRRGYAKEIQLEKGDIASEYASYGEVWVEENFPFMRFKDGKVYTKGELVEINTLTDVDLVDGGNLVGWSGGYTTNSETPDVYSVTRTRGGMRISSSTFEMEKLTNYRSRLRK